MKKCRKCGLTKPLIDFHSASSKLNPSYIRPDCKLCHNKEQRENYCSRRSYYIVYQREHYHKVKHLRLEKVKAKYKTPEWRFWHYKRGAKVRSVSFDLTFDEFKIFWQLDCYYCGAKISTIGLDRVDPSKGYSLSNVVPCCGPCNLAKRGMSKKEFIDLCVRVYRRHGRKPSFAGVTSRGL